MYLKEKLDQIGNIIKEKQRILLEVNGVLGRKLQQSKPA
jgi:hypothetical protein